MVHRPALFVAQTVVVAMVAIVHLSALEWYLYWQYPWLDVLSHFLGGLWVSLASAWILSYLGYSISLTRLVTLSMIVGVGWEVFEIGAGIPREANFVFDTSIDLCMDLMGALCGYVLSRALLRDKINTQ